MGHSGTIINGSGGGVHLLADVRAVLGESSKTFRGICSSLLLNWAAKYKPLRDASEKFLTEADRAAACAGLAVTKYTSPVTLRSGYGDEWSYLRPRGAAYGEPFRLRDFVKVSDSGVSSTTEGYNHAAVGPVYGWATQPQGTYTKGTGGCTFGLQLNPLNQRPAGSISWGDIAPGGLDLSEAYFGFALFKGNNYAYAGVKTMGTQIGQVPQIVEVAFVDADFDGDTTYTFLPLLSMSPFTELTTQVQFVTGLFALPDISEASMYVRSASSSVTATISLTAYYSPGGFTVEADVVIYGTNTFVPIYYSLYGNSTGQSPDLPAIREGLLYDGSHHSPTGVAVSETYVIRQAPPAYVTYEVEADGVVIASETVQII